MDSLLSRRQSHSAWLDGSSRGGDRTRSHVLNATELHTTCKASKKLGSTGRLSSVGSTVEINNQETTKCMNSTMGRCPLAASKTQSTPYPRRIWNKLPAWRLEYEALTPIQQQVMEYVASISEHESAAAKIRLKKTWGAFNISDQDFSQIELYLTQKVPLTIRIDIQELFPHLLHDPFYRYGVLNMVCHPFSDSRVSYFGSAYLLLKDSLRVGTLDHMWHIVETLSAHEITRIHAVATGRRAKATVSPDSKYSEIQIHGMIDVRRDVAAIVVQRKDLENYTKGSLIEDLSKKYLLPILTCEELDENLGDRRWSTVVNQRANNLLQKTMAMHDATFSTASW
ncbi:hypothetical protein, conserved [Eimeria praecox]|uniref:Uncharacterized protein n=1 Tax=Eimeria praecox TaxID=51316 RepID=U6G883_9EIME|nr:hypothetical protein, conserved [Eimeria praecox]